MTMTNADYNVNNRFASELAKLEAARSEKGFTYEALAEKLGVSTIWLCAAMKGQQWVPEDYCAKLAEILEIDPADTAFLNVHPYKGNVDPIIYRLHEVLDVYGPAIKEIIHEKGGNGIMSAIDFSLDVDVIKDPHGDRVILTWNGKLLPYSKQGKYPW